MKLAIIPARGGSKRIPRKNVKMFCGKPMIAWSIEVAIRSNCFDRILVSTDDDEIAQVAKNYKAEVPFIRPSGLADDYIGTIPVIAHAIQWQQQNGKIPQLVCCIYATAPFVTTGDLKSGKDALENTGACYAFSVTSYASPIQRAIRIKDNGRVEMFNPEQFNIRSQDLEDTYHDAGQFYWGQASAWLAGKPIFSEDAVPIILPRHRVQDIDTLEDWTRAEQMFRVLNIAQA